MKNIISLSEFRDLCKSSSFNHFIFSTDNQFSKFINHPMRMNFVFNKLTITFNPDTIFLQDQLGTIQFNRVKHIEVHNEECILGRIFTIVCGESIDTSRNDYVVICR